MKQTMLPLAILLNACLLPSCSIGIGPNASRGQYAEKYAESGATAEVIERSLSVQPFTAIECNLPVAVTYVQTNDQASKVVLKGTPKMIERCIVEVNNGTLKLRLARNPKRFLNSFLKSQDYLKVTVYGGQLTALAVQSACTFYAERLEMPQLAMSNSGASTIRVGRLVGQRLTMSCSGASSTKLAGNVAQLMLNVTGASSFVANEFATQDLKAKVSGASTAKCALQGSAGVDVSGASTLTLSGTADLFTIKCSGASSVKAADLKAQNVVVDVAGASGVKCYAERSIKGTVGCGSLTYGGHPTSFNVERQNSTASIKAVD